MKKNLFLALQELPPCNGITKKIKAENNAFQNNGYISDLCYIATSSKDEKYIVVNDDKIYKFSNGFARKFKRQSMFSAIGNYIVDNGYSLIYIRYLHFADSAFIRFLKSMKKASIKVLIEIPTYPYDSEYSRSNFIIRLQHLVEKTYRNRLKPVCDYIVTFSNDKQIYGIPTINISNAVDKNNIQLRKANGNSESVNLLGVAQISFWHGFDRLIKGLANYYKQDHCYPVHFNIVGNGNIHVIEELKAMTIKLGLSEYVHFLGPKSGTELDVLFDDADLAIGCLACHRKNITEVKSLKNVEYAMRGIPFVYSECNTDFDDKPYVLKIAADDSDIDINSLMSFIKNNSMLPNDIASSVSHLTWDEQIKYVLSFID